MEKLSCLNETVFSRGSCSECYMINGKIVKVMINPGSDYGTSGAKDCLFRAREEYSQIFEHLSPYVIETEFESVELEGSTYLIAKQDFVKGETFRDIQWKPGDLNNLVIDFLQKSLLLYEKTGNMVDIFGRPHIVGWYNPLSTPNVVVSNDNGELIPNLVDVNYSRLSRNPFSRSIHNELLAKGIKRSIGWLSQLNN